MKSLFRKSARTLPHAAVSVALVLSAVFAHAGSAARLYVSNEDTGEIVIVDPAAAQVVGRVPVGKRPRGIKLSPDQKLLYVALSGSPSAGPGVDESQLPPPDRRADGIGIVDLATNKLLRILQGGPDPETFDISPDGKRLYISNEDAATLTVLDVAKGRLLKKVRVGKEPEGVTVRPDGKVIYVACEGDSEVVAVNAISLMAISHIPTDLRPRSIAFSQDGKYAFAAAERGGAVTVIDSIRHRRLASINVPQSAKSSSPARPMGAVLSPDGKNVFVSTGRGGSVAVIDVAGRKLLRTIDGVGTRPWGIGVSPDGKEIYTANGPSGDVSVINVETGTVEHRIKTGGQPWGLVVSNR